MIEGSKAPASDPPPADPIAGEAPEPTGTVAPSAETLADTSVSSAAREPDPAMGLGGDGDARALAGHVATQAPPDSPAPPAPRPDPVRPPPAMRDVDPRRIDTPGRMVRRPGLLMLLTGWVLFRKVAFDERIERQLRDAHDEADLVYVMAYRSRLDYLYFNHAFLQRGLPLVRFANRISMDRFRALWKLAGTKLGRLFGRRSTLLPDPDQLAFAVERGEPGLIFLKRRSVWPWAPADDIATGLFERLVSLQRERLTHAERLAAEATHGQPAVPVRPIRVVPQLLVWNKDPDRYDRSLRDVVFGNPAAPGRVRRVLSFLFNRNKAFVQLGEPIDLAEFLRDSDAPGRRPDELARRLRFTIHRALDVENRVIKGPVLKSSERIRDEILRTQEMRQAIGELAEVEGKAPSDIEARVGRYLKEIGADFSMSYIEALGMALTFVFERIYSELVPDLEGLDRVREAARKSPLILLPCHRSHMDYLIISYLFQAHGLIPPHIAAGANLNFFPMGHIFRRCGAFFLRRSFVGNETYGLAFREYVRKLVKEGHWLEFFLEGGRSRTGKMLPPRYGLLRMLLDAIRDGAVRDVQLVPIYVGYEQVIEERAYSAELAGAEKKKENITSLIRTTKALWSRYGRLYVTFAEPISCRELLEAEGFVADGLQAGRVEAGAVASGDDAATAPGAPRTRGGSPRLTPGTRLTLTGNRPATAGDPDVEKRWQAFVRRTAYRVLHGIHSVALVTPSALVSFVFLVTPKRGLRREELVRHVGLVLEMARHKEAPVSNTLRHELRVRRATIAQLAEDLEAREGQWVRHPLALAEQSPVAFARGEAVLEAVDEVLGRYMKEKHVTSHRFDDGPAPSVDRALPAALPRDTDTAGDPAAPAASPGDADARSPLTRALARAEALDQIVYTPAPDHRVYMDFYKNNIVHLFVHEAILAAALRIVRVTPTAEQDPDGSLPTGARLAPLDVVRAKASWLSQTFKQEFVYDPDRTFDQAFDDTLAQFVEARLVAFADGAGPQTGAPVLMTTPASDRTLHLLHRVLAPWLEAYWMTALALDRYLAEPLAEKDLIKRAQRMSRQAYQEGEVTCPEAGSTVTFKHALAAYVARGVLVKQRKGRERLVARAVRPKDTPDPVPALAAELLEAFPG